MNKKKLLCIAAATLILFSGCGRVSNRAVINEPAVNNGYNNFLAGGRLCRNGDSLFFKSEVGGKDAGVIRIRSGNAKPLESSNGNQLDCRLMENSDTVYAVNEQNYLEYWDAKQKKMINTGRPFISEDAVKQEMFFPLSNVSEIVSGFSDPVYYGQEQIYHLNNETHEVMMFNTSDNSDTAICVLPSGSTLKSMVTDGNYIIYTDSDNMLFAAITGDSAVPARLSQSPVTCFNVCGDSVYYSTAEGLWKFSISGLTSSELRYNEAESEAVLLYAGSVNQCYIVDSVWVYFVTPGSSLIRVTADGSNKVQTIYTGDE